MTNPASIPFVRNCTRLLPIFASSQLIFNMKLWIKLAILAIFLNSNSDVRCQIHTGWFGLQAPGDFADCKKDYEAATTKPHPDIGLSLDEIITKYGYPVQRVNVVTEDGYILGIYRIPHGRMEVSPPIPGQRRKAVYIAHGFFCNAHSWLVQPYSRNLAFLLADSGFDVFLGNVRGTRYSQAHIDPAMSPVTRKYWDFSWHEMGVFDLPAVVDAMIRLTGQPKVYYIGHSMGGTYFATGVSERPELNDKIATAFLLAPGGTIYNARSFLRFLIAITNSMRPLFELVLGGRIDQIQKLFDFIGVPLGYFCAPTAMACGACGTLMFFLFGYDAPQTNYTAIPLLTNLFPETMSTKTFIHFAQGQVTNTMSHFDQGSPELNMKKYGQSHPPRYNFSRITIPIVMYYGASDNLIAPEDVYQLAAWIGPAVKEVNEIKWKLFNHADFLQAKDADDLLYKDIRNKILYSTYG